MAYLDNLAHDIVRLNREHTSTSNEMKPAAAVMNKGNRYCRINSLAKQYDQLRQCDVEMAQSISSVFFKNSKKMARILFRLQGVSDDEANDVRELLTNNTIDFYETSAGNWGVSMPAIWIKNDDQFQQARALLDRYQNERTARMREEYARSKREGKNKTLMDAIKQNPISLIIHLALAVLVIYLSIKLVIDLAP